MMNVSLFGGNGFDELDELAKAATSAFGKSFPSIPKLTDRVDFPLDEYTEKDGTFVVEVAVVGMSDDDVKVTVKTENGQNTLTIKAVPSEIAKEEKDAIDARQYTFKKIKRSTKLDYSRTLPSNLDVKNTTKKVENGLLTIRIPVKEEEKPMEIEIK